jgi:hypothetical protein
MSHSMRISVHGEPWIEDVYIAHNSDWSGEARIKWTRVLRDDGTCRECRTEEVRLPGVIIKALIEDTNGVAIERIRELLERLEAGG